MKKKLTKKFELVNYNFGIISNIPLDDFICQILDEEPQYDLFQVVDGVYATMGIVEHYRYLLLKRRV